MTGAASARAPDELCAGRTNPLAGVRRIHAGPARRNCQRINSTIAYGPIWNWNTEDAWSRVLRKIFPSTPSTPNSRLGVFPGSSRTAPPHLTHHRWRPSRTRPGDLAATKLAGAVRTTRPRTSPHTTDGLTSNSIPTRSQGFHRYRTVATSSSPNAASTTLRSPRSNTAMTGFAVPPASTVNASPLSPNEGGHIRFLACVERCPFSVFCYLPRILGLHVQDLRQYLPRRTGRATGLLDTLIFLSLDLHRKQEALDRRQSLRLDRSTTGSYLREYNRRV